MREIMTRRDLEVLEKADNSLYGTYRRGIAELRAHARGLADGRHKDSVLRRMAKLECQLARTELALAKAMGRPEDALGALERKARDMAGEVRKWQEKTGDAGDAWVDI